MAWQGLRPESLLNLWRQEGCTGCKDRETCINCEGRKIQPREMVCFCGKLMIFLRGPWKDGPLFQILMQEL